MLAFVFDLRLLITHLGATVVLIVC